MGRADKLLVSKGLNFLIRIGMRLAIPNLVKNGSAAMEQEHGQVVGIADAALRASLQVPVAGERGKYSSVELGEEEVRNLRHLLHEMANVFTGILVTGGLLHQALEGDLRQRYTGELCTGGERGAALVRQAREVLLAPSERMKV